MRYFIKKHFKKNFELLFQKVFSSYVLIDKNSEESYLKKDVPERIYGHLEWKEHLYENWNIKGMRILEIGSREVTGKSEARERFSNAEYIGFDYYPGNNVDVVGDAHKLSKCIKPGDKFDLIYSSACFEHFAMPWVVAVEIAKLLKLGGSVFIETHFSFSSHERPWNFFQFSDMGLRSLFSPAMGFECIDAGMSNPIVGRFSNHADEYLRNLPVRGLYCHSSFFGRKAKEIQDYQWEKISLEEVVGMTKYPTTLREVF